MDFEQLKTADVRDGRAPTAMGATAEINDDLKSGFNLQALQAAVEAEPDDARAAKLVEDAIMADPLGAMYAIMDAEAITDAESAAWERAIVDFAKRERIEPKPFRYSCARPPILQRKPWLDFGTHWPYCFAYLSEHDAWIPLGRNYKPLGEEQWQGESFDYNKFAHTAWRFIDDPTTFGDDIWTRVGPGRLWLYGGDLATRRDYFDRVGRLIALTDDPIKYARRLTWRDDPAPPIAGAPALAA